ncbi:hypothetical protein [Streptomyces sp. NBC_00503]|uniref:hypothetical protein n=1 Tax=Streptomyces sp. NBC_00503 TaxID=2903659 RepID=UPI002E81BE1C|nr:hypothetical protein [Streptomyces sp. NBC_00503]WUD80216.1 hypothetical protein OG490_06405 [Streptomyces sp. NBC_00503]
MTTMESSTPRVGRRRRAPAAEHEESVRHTPDPPIYSALLTHWAEDGRTVPGRRDPEWTKIASSPIWPTGPLFGG